MALQFLVNDEEDLLQNPNPITPCAPITNTQHNHLPYVLQSLYSTSPYYTLHISLSQIQACLSARQTLICITPTLELLYKI